MDRIIASNNPNNYIDVNKGVLESHETQNIRTRSITYGNGTTVLDLYNYKEDFHDVYQFLVDNSEVEWAYMSLKDQSGSDLFYMGTSHSHNTNATPSFVYYRSLDRNYTILSFEHNHDLGNDVVSYGDVEIAKTIQGKFPKASLKIGFPFTTEKVFYDRNTIPATLKGVEVVAPLPEKFKNKQHK
ncbi:JAB-like toxin 1 domain-containing protein [Prevotella corporis]